MRIGSQTTPLLGQRFLTRLLLALMLVGLARSAVDLRAQQLQPGQKSLPVITRVGQIRQLMPDAQRWAIPFACVRW